MAEPSPPAGDRSRKARPAAGRSPVRKRKPLIQVDPAANREPTVTEQIATEVKRDWPGVLISLGLHAVVLLIFALIPILLDPDRPIGIISLEWATDAPKTAITPPQPVQLTNPIQLTRPASTTPPKAVQPVAPTPEPAQTSPPVQPVDVSHSLGSRQPRDRGHVSSRDGFNEDARQAIDRALRWLAKQQYEDGHWSLDGPYADGATRTRWSTDVGATALTLLALLGDGNTHSSGDYAANVEKGLRWLMTRQRPSGEIYDGSEEGEEPSIYSHAMSVIVLCETLALTGDEQFREPAAKGVEYLIAAQNPVRGGWGYRPLTESGEGDLSVSGWALMALHTARMAGLEVNSQAFLLASMFIDSCQESQADPSRYKYRPSWSANRDQRASMTASGLLARQWLGWPRSLGTLKAGQQYLLGDEARPEWENGHRNVYAWYYQAQVLHNLGGDDWRSWFAELQQIIVSRQIAAGKEAGSWHPTKPPGNPLEEADKVGRLYVTVMCVLILETPFRHAPLYEDSAR